MTASLRDFNFTITPLSTSITMNNMSFHCLSPEYAKIYFDISTSNLAVTTGINNMQIGLISSPSFIDFEGNWHSINDIISYKVSITSSYVLISIRSTLTTALTENIKNDDTLIITSNIENMIPSYSLMW